MRIAEGLVLTACLSATLSGRRIKQMHRSFGSCSLLASLAVAQDDKTQAMFAKGDEQVTSGKTMFELLSK
jgi:hypothetical protein